MNMMKNIDKIILIY